MPDEAEVKEQPQQETEEKQETPELARETIDQEVFDTRSLIPVGKGAQTLDWANAVTMAKDITRAYQFLPEFLHDNVASCVAIIEKASRVGLSPYDVAGECYEMNGRIGYSSKLIMAFVYRSGELEGTLDYEWEGDGEEMHCICSGRLKRDPTKLKVLKGGPIKQIRPVRNERGQVRGSPLWDKKPYMQTAYDIQRDWARLYCPQAILGMQTPEEIAAEVAAEREQVSDLKTRLLSGDRVESREGFDKAHVDSELARAVPAPGPSIGRVITSAELEEEMERRAPRPVKRAKPRQDPPHRRQTARRQQPSKADVKRAADRAAQPGKKKAAPIPAWLDYVKQTEAWIGMATMAAAAWAKWEEERDKRDKLGVPIPERNRLGKMLADKFVDPNEAL